MSSPPKSGANSPLLTPDIDHLDGAPVPPMTSNDCEDVEQPGLSTRVSEVDLSSYDEVVLTRPPEMLFNCECYKKRSRTCKACLVCGGCTFITIVIALPIIFLVVIPTFVQSTVDGSTVTVVSAVMSKPDSEANTIRMATNLTLNNAGVVAAHLDAATVQLSHSGGASFAYMKLPSIDIQASAPTPINTDTTLTVTDSAAFAAATVPLLQGHSSIWRVAGSSTIHALGMAVNVDITFELTLPATVLAAVEAANCQVIDGDEDNLYAIADMNFVSASILQMEDLGPMTFGVWTKDPDAGGIQLGTAGTSNFQVLRGYNSISKSTTTMTRTSENAAAIAEFVGRQLTGEDQELMLVGPINGTKFLQKITKQKIKLKGSDPYAARPIKAAFLSTQGLEGHKVGTSDSCGTSIKGDCVRGSSIVMLNPQPVAIKQSNVVIDVGMRTPVPAYTFKNLLLKPGGEKCAASSQFVRMYTRKGMYVTDTDKDDIDLPALSSGLSTSFYMPAGPQPGQDTGSACQVLGQGSPYGCCFTTVQLAAACHAHERGLAHFDTNLTGTATLTIGSFVVNVTMSQDRVPTVYDQALISKGLFGMIKCSDLKWV